MRALYLPSLLCPQGWPGDQGSAGVSQSLSRGRRRPIRLRKEENPCQSLSRASVPPAAPADRAHLGGCFVHPASSGKGLLPCSPVAAAPAKSVFFPKSQALHALAETTLLLMPQFTPGRQWGPCPPAWRVWLMGLFPQSWRRISPGGPGRSAS